VRGWWRRRGRRRLNVASGAHSVIISSTSWVDEALCHVFSISSIAYLEKPISVRDFPEQVRGFCAGTPDD
jgi:hypothetical protein